MTTKLEEAQTFLKTNRIEALHDGVFAIVMTLLVLELKVPEMHGEWARAELMAALQKLAPAFFSYLLSFVMLGVYWVGQHAQFNFIRYVDRTALWINILFLMSVSLLPFTAAFIGHYLHDELAIALYGLNLIIIGLIAFVHWTYATVHHRLVDHSIPDAFVSGVKRRIAVAPLLCILAIVVSPLSTTLSLVIYALIPLYYIIPGSVDAIWRRPAVPHGH